MKRKFIATVSAAALSVAMLTGAPAFAQAQQLEDSVAQGLIELGFQVETLPPLTVEQVAGVENVLGGTDADEIKQQHIAEILGMSEAQAGVGQGASGQLRDSVSASMVQLGMDTSGVEQLSVEQLTEIEAVASSEDTDDIKRERIAEITGASAATAGVGSGAAGQLKDSVAAELVQLGVDTEKVEMLSVEELTQIENVVNSGVSEADKKAQIDAIMTQ